MTLRVLILFCSVLFVLQLVNTLPPYGLKRIHGPNPANFADNFATLRKIRATAEDSDKGDLEGSETAVIAYPYLSYPYYGYHIPVVYFGK